MPMLTMFLGIFTDARLLQPANALSPMLVMLLGIVIAVKLSQYANALFGILDTQPNSILLSLPTGPAVLRLLQPIKAFMPMLVTLFGIIVLLSSSQFAKAHSPILVIPLSILICLIRFLL